MLGTQSSHFCQGVANALDDHIAALRHSNGLELKQAFEQAKFREVGACDFGRLSPNMP